MSERSAILDTIKAANLESIKRCDEEEECISCGEMHVPVDGLYLGRDRYACSEACWDEYVQWGRWERPE